MLLSIPDDEESIKTALEYLEGAGGIIAEVVDPESERASRKDGCDEENEMYAEEDTDYADGEDSRQE